MTEIWITSRRQPVPVRWGVVESTRARKVAAELNRKGYKTKLRCAELQDA